MPVAHTAVEVCAFFFFKHLLWLRQRFIDDWWQYALREMYVCAFSV